MLQRRHPFEFFRNVRDVPIWRCWRSAVGLTARRRQSVWLLLRASITDRRSASGPKDRRVRPARQQNAAASAFGREEGSEGTTSEIGGKLNDSPKVPTDI